MQVARQRIRDSCASEIADGGPIEVSGITMSSRKSLMPHRRRGTGTTPSW